MGNREEPIPAPGGGDTGVGLGVGGGSRAEKLVTDARTGEKSE